MILRRTETTAKLVANDPNHRRVTIGKLKQDFDGFPQSVSLPLL
jgi:hypothetical protein